MKNGFYWIDIIYGPLQGDGVEIGRLSGDMFFTTRMNGDGEVIGITNDPQYVTVISGPLPEPDQNKTECTVLEDVAKRVENLGQNYGSRDGGKCLRLPVPYDEYAKQLNWEQRTRGGSIAISFVEAHYLSELAETLRTEARKV